MAVKFTITRGCFNLCDPREVSYQIRLETPHGIVRASTSDDPGDAGGYDVEDAVTLIRECWSKFIYTGHRTEGEPILARIEADLLSLELDLAKSHLASLQAASERASTAVHRQMKIIASLSREISDQESA